MAGGNAQSFQSPLVGKNTDARTGRVLDTITANQPRPGYDMLSTPMPGGVILNALGGKGGVRGADHPWKFRKAGGKKFTLTSGSVSSIIPTGMNTEFTASPSGIFVWVKAKLNEDGTPTEIVLESGASPPVPDLSWFNADAPPDVTYYPLLKVFSDGEATSTVEQMESRNLSISRNVVSVGCALNEYQVAWKTV